ncbi:unnamed protein product [Adineta steineri]|uniref:G-protein coupled receptors family 1 profile domain-containing protein n=1 Tax=Adineta steineri TaxID=433720 RepID=A0A815JBC2_9BILA|nr:unnamed protein product [Adineta steineri]CAF3932804.1 unnamed protein product [Adineta steineri]
MLYGWNLDHYLSIIHGFTLITYSIPTCKIFGFLNYFAAQSSAWLRVFICFDRYLITSRLHRTWFSRQKSVLIIITCIITITTLLNCHFLIFTCYYSSDGTINPNAKLYEIYPLWDYVNYSGVIYHLIHRRLVQLIQNSTIQYRAISITLIITTFLFLIMTTPATIDAAFFATTPTGILEKILDSALYTYHITSFLLYFITFKDFRRECIMLMTCKINNPQKIVPTQTPSIPPKTPN